uniref:Nipped-B protein n=1 Tax=Steinernema glaseri TaxID=37863 RepID=A0A1I7Z9A1_9BILA
MDDQQRRLMGNLSNFEGLPVGTAASQNCPMPLNINAQQTNMFQQQQYNSLLHQQYMNNIDQVQQALYSNPQIVSQHMDMNTFQQPQLFHAATALQLQQQLHQQQLQQQQQQQHHQSHPLQHQTQQHLPVHMQMQSRQEQLTLNHSQQLLQHQLEQQQMQHPQQQLQQAELLRRQHHQQAEAALAARAQQQEMLRIAEEQDMRDRIAADEERKRIITAECHRQQAEVEAAVLRMHEKQKEEMKLQKELQRRQQREEAYKAQMKQKRLEAEERQRQEEQRLLEEKRRREQEERTRVEQEMKRKQAELEEASKELQHKLSLFPEPLHFGSIHPLTKLGHHLPFPEEDMRSSYLLPVMNFSERNKELLLKKVEQNLLNGISIALLDVTAEIGDIEMKSIEQEEFSVNDCHGIPDLIRQVNDFNIDNFTVESAPGLDFEDIASTALADDQVEKMGLSSYTELTKAQEKPVKPLSAVPTTPAACEAQPSTSAQSAPMSAVTDVATISRDQSQLRKQMVSVGKQPKAQQNRRKKDMLESLFDSLTGYFDPAGDRRRRQRVKTYSEEQQDKMEIEMVAQNVAQEEAMKAKEKEEGDNKAKFFERANKRGRKRAHEDSPGERLFERESTPTEVLEQRNAEWRERQRRKAEKMRQRQLDSNSDAWNTDLMAQKDSLHRFDSIIEAIFDNIEDVETSIELDEDAEIPQELLLDRSTLEMLRLEAQKLKSWKSIHKMQPDRLVKLLTILERNMREVINADGSQAMYIPVEGIEDDSEEAYRELFNEKVLRTADAACIVLLILTSPKMPKQVFIEDTIDRSVQLSKHLVLNIIIPMNDVSVSSSAKKKEAKKARMMSDSRHHVAKTVYARLCELLGCFAELVKFEGVGETAVIHLVSTCTPIFFVENIGELQIQAIKVLTAVFSQYPEQRTSILHELLNSLHRLPLTRNSRNCYRMNSEEWAGNVTVLFLQLIQSAIKVPKRRKTTVDDEDEELVEFSSVNDGIVKESFSQAEKMIHFFINGFLSKCTAKSDEDYRKLFDNFLHDLLAALYKPEFPAAEIVMLQLGTLLVKFYRTKTNEMSLRVACLDYLGTITARLRRDRTMNAQLQNDERMNTVIKAIVYDDLEDPPENVADVDISQMSANEKMRTLEQAIIDYLIDKKGLDDLTVDYAMNYYAGEWYNETTEDLESARQRNRTAAKELHNDRDLKKLDKKLSKLTEKGNAMKNFLIKLVDRKHLKKRAQHVQRTGNVMIDSDANWVVKYLAARREFSQAFMSYMKHILYGIRNETAVGLRTKATRCLTQIIEVDSEVLLIPEVHEAVKSRTLDPNSAVREATIELIGKYLVQHPELFPKYYRIIVDRIRDTGVAVRKRVIRTLRELCERDPTFERVPEMLCQIMRRISDEDSVKKLALESLQTFWFTPHRDQDSVLLEQKLSTLCEVVEICNRANFMENFDVLFSTAFKCEDRSAKTAAKQLIDTLVNNILNLDEAVGKDEKEAISGGEVHVEAGLRHHKSQADLAASVRCLFLFSKACPKYLAKYVEILQPYLSVATGSNFDLTIVQQMVAMMENVVPLLDHPSDSFLSNLDKQLAELIKNSGMAIIRSAVKCSSVLYNRFKRVKPTTMDLFLTNLKWLNTAVVRSETTQYSVPERAYPVVKRYLYTVGLLSRFFDVDDLVTDISTAREALCDMIFESNFKQPPPAKYQINPEKEKIFLSSVFNMLIFFSRARDAKIRKTALDAIGNFTAEHSDFLERDEMKNMYMVLLRMEDPNYLELKIQTLQNLELFLEIEEEKSIRMNAQWNKVKDAQDLKEMELAFSGRASAIIQIYWNSVLNAVFSTSTQVRQAASKVVFMTLGQGLVTPGSSIPTVIAITTDEKSLVQIKMETILKDIDLKYPTMVASRSIAGIRQSFRLQTVIHSMDMVRGLRCTPHEAHDRKITIAPNGLPKYANDCQATLSSLYLILRSNRQQRRSFLSMVLRLFQDENKEKLSVPELLYVADNLALFPYQVLDEPLYVIHQADAIISLCGQRVIRRFPDDKTRLFECLQSSQGCFLLLYLKSFLMKLYGFNESRIQEYLPTDHAKVYDKALTRKNCATFHPEVVLQELQPEILKERDTVSGHIQIAHRMVYFRNMMLSLEKHEEEGEESEMAETAPADKTNDDEDSEHEQ